MGASRGDGVYVHGWGDVAELAAADAPSAADLADAESSGRAWQGRAEDAIPAAVAARIASALPRNDFAVSGRLLQPVGRAVAPLAALLNHSCCGNCAVVTEPPVPGSPPVLAVRAILPAARGEALTHAYVPPDTPLADRRDILARRYGFECLCALCRTEAGDPGAAAELKAMGWPTAEPGEVGSSEWPGIAAAAAAVVAAAADQVNHAGPAAALCAVSVAAAVTRCCPALGGEAAAAVAACAAAERCGGAASLGVTVARKGVIEALLLEGRLEGAAVGAAVLAARELCVLPAAHPSCGIRLAVMEELCRAVDEGSDPLGSARAAAGED